MMNWENKHLYDCHFLIKSNYGPFHFKRYAYLNFIWAQKSTTSKIRTKLAEGTSAAEYAVVSSLNWIRKKRKLELRTYRATYKDFTRSERSLLICCKDWHRHFIQESDLIFYKNSYNNQNFKQQKRITSDLLQFNQSMLHNHDVLIERRRKHRPRPSFVSNILVLVF